MENDSHMARRQGSSHGVPLMAAITASGSGSTEVFGRTFGSFTLYTAPSSAFRAAATAAQLFFMVFADRSLPVLGLMSLASLFISCWILSALS